MVKLSPKALRFAEGATRLAATTYGTPDGRAAVLNDWTQQSVGRRPDDRARAAEAFVEVPDDVAFVFLDAIGAEIHQREQAIGISGEVDPDSGNDLAFLHAIEASLTQDLDPDRANEARRRTI